MAIVVLSDIHIGTNGPTSWYQKDYHEPYLKAIFDEIINGKSWAEEISELVLLGDIVDLWTYPAEDIPPSFDEIMRANPAIFGPSGSLSQVLTALKGNVTYVRGNHDMTITQADLDKIDNPNYKIKLCPDDIYIPLGSKTLFTHGHIFTMFNAPYTNNNPIAPLPLGHFVTRAIATWRAKQIHDGVFPGVTNVAQLKDSGAPDGMSELFPISLIRDLIKHGDPSIARILLEAVQNKTKIDDQQIVRVSSNLSLTFAQAKQIYQKLFTEWQEREGGGQDGLLVAGKGVYADYDGTYMGWFAQRLALQKGVDCVVTGHTHIALEGLSDSCIKYLNAGFNCPYLPVSYQRDQHPTFIAVSPDGSGGVVHVVKSPEGDGFIFDSSHPGTTYIVDKVDYSPSPGGNFSCYVQIDNRNIESHGDLVRESYGVTKSTFPPGQDCGHYINLPPEIIKVGEWGRFWIQDYPGPHGAEGWVTYKDKNGVSIKFTYGCPTGSYDNYASSSSEGGAYFRVFTKVGSTNEEWQEMVVQKSHPLHISFVRAKPLYAGYGHGNRVLNVSDRVQDLWKNGVRKFNANSGIYTDPCPGKIKALFIVWKENGKMFSGISIDWDNTWFELPPRPKVEKEMPVSNGVIYAGYGYGTSVTDVTNKVLEQWKDGVRKFNANSRTYGDPCPGIKKALFIIWSVNGKMFSGTSIDWDNTWFELSGLE
jgi:UDP-2,3-diacylglucosamine pyrophosphatase LpxH